MKVDPAVTLSAFRTPIASFTDPEQSFADVLAMLEALKAAIPDRAFAFGAAGLFGTASQPAAQALGHASQAEDGLPVRDRSVPRMADAFRERNLPPDAANHAYDGQSRRLLAPVGQVFERPSAQVKPPVRSQVNEVCQVPTPRDETNACSSPEHHAGPTLTPSQDGATAPKADSADAADRPEQRARQHVERAQPAKAPAPAEPAATPALAHAPSQTSGPTRLADSDPAAEATPAARSLAPSQPVVAGPPVTSAPPIEMAAPSAAAAAVEPASSAVVPTALGTPNRPAASVSKPEAQSTARPAFKPSQLLSQSAAASEPSNALSVIVQDQGARLAVVLAGPALSEPDRARLRQLAARLLADYGRTFETISFNGEDLAVAGSTPGGPSGHHAR